MTFLYILLAVAVIFVYFFRREIKEKIVPNKEKNYTIDDRFNSERREREKEIDRILSKLIKTESRICLKKTENA